MAIRRWRSSRSRLASKSAHCENYRSVYREYKDSAAGGDISFSVAQELVALPDRDEIIKDNPKLKKREARKLRQERKSSLKEDWKVVQTRRWFKELLERTGEAISEADLTNARLGPDRWGILRLLMVATLPANLRDAAAAWNRLADYLESVRDNETPAEAETAAEVETTEIGRIGRSGEHSGGETPVEVERPAETEPAEIANSRTRARGSRARGTRVTRAGGLVMADRPNPLENGRWWDGTWNPVGGCELVSPGCLYCYAAQLAGGIQTATETDLYLGTTMERDGNHIFNGKLTVLPQATRIGDIRLIG